MPILLYIIAICLAGLFLYVAVRRFEPNRPLAILLMILILGITVSDRMPFPRSADRGGPDKVLSADHWRTGPEDSATNFDRGNWSAAAPNAERVCRVHDMTIGLNLFIVSRLARSPP